MGLILLNSKTEHVYICPEQNWYWPCLTGPRLIPPPVTPPPPQCGQTHHMELHYCKHCKLKGRKEEGRLYQVPPRSPFVAFITPNVAWFQETTWLFPTGILIKSEWKEQDNRRKMEWNYGANGPWSRSEIVSCQTSSVSQVIQYNGILLDQIFDEEQKSNVPAL